MSDTLSAIVTNARPKRAQPALYVGLDADAPTTPPARISLTGLDRIEIRRADARKIAFDRVDGAEVVEIGLADARLSQRHARLERSGAAWVFHDLGSRNGSWVAGRRIKRHELADGDVVIAGHTALIYRASGGDSPNLVAPTKPVAAGFQTMSPQLAVQFAELSHAARTAIAIEIGGETGTGKELVARGVHVLSERTGAFIPVNCGAIASTLVEGELFGHKKGAFTGATEDRLGLIRSADRGTLFLDEIAELPSSTQAALLRVLQEGEVTPLGGDRPVRVDVRIVTATHQDLDAAVAAGRFRADLRARLLGLQFRLPALRERREDLSLLVAALLPRDERRTKICFTVDAVGALYAYDWPLNIRELERALAAATAVPRDRITIAHLPASLQADVADGAATAIAVAVDAEVAVDEASLSDADRALRAQLAASIARHAGNLAEVGRELAKDRTQIRRWMKRFGLRR